jgi:hypothetical protein
VNSLKCPQCALVNFAEVSQCRRCGHYLGAAVAAPAGGTASGTAESAEPAENPNLTLRVLPVAGTILALVFAWWASLLMSSSGLAAEQRVTVERAVAILRARGFEREVFLLDNMTFFRSTDNWWNKHVGHAQAYAATNFPFQIITLYPPFFERSADDVERAVILLHEAQHLRGRDEPTALAEVWREKARVGWTAANYGHTRVWKNTREWTHMELPRLFACGIDFKSDCYE